MNLHIWNLRIMRTDCTTRIYMKQESFWLLWNIDYDDLVRSTVLTLKSILLFIQNFYFLVKDHFPLLRPLHISNCHSEPVGLLGVGRCIFFSKGQQLDFMNSRGKCPTVSSPMFMTQGWPQENYRWLMLGIFAPLERILHDCLKKLLFWSKSCPLWVTASLTFHIASGCSEIHFCCFLPISILRQRMNGCRILKHYAILSHKSNTQIHVL